MNRIEFVYDNQCKLNIEKIDIKRAFSFAVPTCYLEFTVKLDGRPCFSKESDMCIVRYYDSSGKMQFSKSFINLKLLSIVTTIAIDEAVVPTAVVCYQAEI